MAKVTLKEKRELKAGYHVYTLATPSGDLVTVRRKVAMPTDVEHSSSIATRRQRHRFGAASRRWSRLSPKEKLIMSQRYGFVDQRHSPTKSKPTVLQGRELFIAEDIHEQEYHDRHAPLPSKVCIVLCDRNYNALDGSLTLHAFQDTTARQVPRARLKAGHFYFYVPDPPPSPSIRYHPHGTCPGYVDMNDLYLFYPDLIDYRCHILLTEEEAALPEAHWIVTDWIYQETATQYVVLGKRTPTQDTLWSENTCVKEPRPAPETWEFNCYYLPTGEIDNRVLLAHSHATVPQCEFGAPECFYTFHFGPLFVQQGQWYLSEWMHPK